MMLKMFRTTDEVLLFAVDGEGNAIGDEAFFEGKEEDGYKGERDPEDYDASLIELPLAISTGDLQAEPDRVLKGVGA